MRARTTPESLKSEPAIVLGAGINGLGVARSLARAGVRVWLLDPDERRPEMHTRAAKALKVRCLHDETLIEDLERLVATTFKASCPVLYLTQEATVRTVSRHRERLARHYRFDLPAKEVVEALQHKEGFQRLAEQHGAPVPPLVRIHAPADLPALETLRYPVVVKPGERNAGYSQQFNKAYRVDDPKHAVELVRRILPVMPDVVVQEWIDGPDANIYFCLQYINAQGCVAASFTGRKIRSWPPQVGGTASCIAAPEAHAELDAVTTRYFASVGVVGMASMEYKRDARSGDFLMVEPTIGRTDYQEEVATLNGVNMPHAAYCANTGLPCPVPVAPARPMAWRVRSADLQSAVAQDQKPEAGYPAGTYVADALYRWRDPMPWLVQSLQRARRKLHHRPARAMPGMQAVGNKP